MDLFQTKSDNILVTLLGLFLRSRDSGLVMTNGWAVTQALASPHPTPSQQKRTFLVKWELGAMGHNAVRCHLESYKHQILQGGSGFKFDKNLPGLVMLCMDKRATLANPCMVVWSFGYIRIWNPFFTILKTQIHILEA